MAQNRFSLFLTAKFLTLKPSRMKNLFTLLVVSLFFFSSSAQTVPQTKLALISTQTATWCGPCGTWAWPLQESIVEDNQGNAVCVELHCSTSDDIYNATAGAIQGNFPASTSFPSWFLNGHNATVYSSSGGIYPTLTQDALLTGADSTAGTTANVQSIYTASLSGSNLTVNATAKFFNAVSGEYYLGIYIIENDVIAYQEGIGNSAHHQNVLRASMSSIAFGDQIATGNTAANTIVNHTFNYTLNSTWHANNIWLAAILWKKVGGIYYYENAYTDNAKITGVDEPMEPALQLSLYPNPLQSEGQLSMTLENTVDHCIVYLSDITGRNVAMLYQGNLSQGQHDFAIDAKDLSEGMYTLNILADGILSSRKLIVTR